MWTALALFYFTCMVIGFVVALVGAIAGEFGGHVSVGDHGVEIGHGGAEAGHELGHAETGQAGVESHDISGGHDVGINAGHDMPTASVMNTITMATFLGFFGIAGLVGVWGFGLKPLPSLAFALPTAIVMAAAEFLMYVKYFVNSQASSEATSEETEGHEAEVITAIPEGKVGEIAYVIKGTRYTSPAVSEKGEAIEHGRKVIIVGSRDNYTIVIPFE